MTEPDVGAVVSLREMTSENFKPVLNLGVTPDQQRFIATNDRSIAEAHFSDQAWYRAIYADEEPVGFVMVADEFCGTKADPDQNCGLWRFMIDAHYQRMGFGTKALELVVEHVRSHPDAEILLMSYIPANRAAENFFMKFGFQPYLGPYPTPPGEMTLVYLL